MGTFDTSYAAGGMADAFAKLLARRDLLRERDRDYQIRMAELAMQQEQAKRVTENDSINRAIQARTISLDNIKRLEGTPISHVPFEQREGPDGGAQILSVTNDLTPERVNRFKPTEVPGIPQLNVGSVQMRPRTMDEVNEAAREAARAKALEGAHVLNPQQELYVGDELVAKNTNEDPSKMASITREWMDAKRFDGYTGSLTQYMNEDANRKRSTTVINPSGLSPSQEFRETRQLNGDWMKIAGDMITARSALATMQAGLKGATEGSFNAGGQAVLVKFQKLLDPGSVVRESEYARSAAGLSLAHRLEGLYVKIKQGGPGVTLADLNEFVRVADNLYKGQMKLLDPYKKRIERVADKYGLDKDLIFEDQDEMQPGGDDASAPNPAAAGGDAYDRLQQRLAAGGGQKKGGLRVLPAKDNGR